MKKRYLNAGDLRHRVTLMRAVESLNNLNEPILTYEPVGTYFALVQGLRAFEQVNASQYKGLAMWRVTLRAASGPILPSDVITWNGHTLNVVGAVTDPFNIFIEVDVTEKPAQ